MATCKTCGEPIDWAQHEGKWVPLVPIGSEGNHPRTHIDSDCVLRVKHSAICDHKKVVTITPLKTPVYVAVPQQHHEESMFVQREHRHRVGALTEHCPTCYARPGETCRSPKGRERHALHRARYVIT